MRRPETITKEYLKQQQLKQGSIGTGISFSYMNPNPKLRKYTYWVYHYEMPYASTLDIFFKHEHRLSFKQYSNLIKYLQSNKIPYVFANRSQHRLGTKIFDYKKLKAEWPDIKFAVTFEQDSDEEYLGHK